MTIHYAEGSIVALGQANGPPREAERPRELSEEAWGQEGLLAPVKYWELSAPIPLAEIPLDL